MCSVTVAFLRVSLFAVYHGQLCFSLSLTVWCSLVPVGVNCISAICNKTKSRWFGYVEHKNGADWVKQCVMRELEIGEEYLVDGFCKYMNSVDLS